MNIILDQGYIVIIDDEDYDKIKNYKWKILRLSDTRIVAKTVTYCKRKANQIMMHRLIMGVENRSRPIIDHINRNTLDNRKSNLRFANHQNNGMNRGKSNRTGGTASKYKGVYYKKGKHRKKRWYSKVCTKNQNYCCGVYYDECGAAKAYDKKALELFGEFAYLNFPELKEEYLKEIYHGVESDSQ